MKKTLIFLVSLAAASTLAAHDFYQLKIYRLEGASQEAVVDRYLKNAFLPALHRAGVETVGVFKPIIEDPAEERKIVVFIPLKQIGQIDMIETALANDKKHQSAGSDYLDAPWDSPPYVRIESTILKAFKAMPHFALPDHSAPQSERVYELRSYEGATEKLYQRKVEMFNEGGEAALFKRLQFQPVFFAETLSGSAMPNLMYMTTFSSMQSREEHWDAFRSDPEWLKMKALKRYENTVSNSVTYLMRPTQYSDF